MKCAFQEEGDADMTMIRFFCPQCGAGQEADDMEEGVFCPYCGTYIDVARYFGRPDGNMEKGNSSEGIKTYVQVNPYNQRGMEAVYASPDVMIRKSRKHEKKREKKHKKADRPYPFNHSGTSSDGSSSQMMFRPQWDQTPMRQLYATPPFVEEERRRRREGLSTSEGNGNKDEK